ncbi:hypothetical protein SEA_JACKIEB_65 [Streptomyces phage JackieB]|nr:hypothetical protein SEA_JACKIEB_65 [Streptomyces phage JackieB]
MSGSEYPGFTSIIDSDQIITREISLADAGDDRFDFPAKYRGGTFRPSRIKLVYRVNRGSSEPYWYLFQVKITAAKVLKGGRISDAYSNQIAESFYPEHAPEWARKMGADLLPVVKAERTAPGV